MDTEGPSRTALATARARAHHQFADRPVILVDALAARVLGVTSEELSADGERAADRPRRLFFAARARFAEDRVASAAAVGVRQVVVLGAGMDTFALRNPHAGLRVFEVDHPATQAWKCQRLAEAEIDVPDSVSFVPVDFETDSLATELEAAGFGRAEPAVFVWLGVVFYLTLDAVLATLDFIAGQSGPADVVFDYLRPGDTDRDRARLQDRATPLATAGEPWFSYFTPQEIARHLRDRGFAELEDLSAAELIDLYSEGTTSYRVETPDELRPSRILRATR